MQDDHSAVSDRPAEPPRVVPEAPLADSRPGETPAPATEDVDPVNAVLSFNPLSWKAKMMEHLERSAEKSSSERLASLDPLLEPYPSEQQEAARKAVRDSLMKSDRGRFWPELIDLGGAWAVLAIAAGALPATAIVGWVIGPSMDWKFLTGRAIFALVLAGFVVAALYVLANRVDNIVVVLAIPIGLIVALSILAILPRWWSGTPRWLGNRFTHFGLVATADCLGAAALLIMTYWVLWRATEVLSARTMRRKHPEEHFVNTVSHLVHKLPSLDNASKIFIRETEDAAQTMEQFWSKSLRIRYPWLHESQTKLARQIGAATREPQLSVCIGAVKPADLRSWLVDLLVAVVTRDVATFRLFEEEVSSSAAKLVWWRRIGRGLAAIILFMLAAALLVVASWQPGLPDVMRESGWTELGNAVTFDERYRTALAAGALGLLRAVVALFGKPGGGEAEGRSLRPSGISRRRQR